MSVRWYESFFQGIALDLWRKVVSPEQTGREADFLERALGLKPGARVLDVPCGFGRHAIELAGRGYAVTGVDFTREALDEARERASERGLDVDWVQADMLDLAWEAKYDGAFCLGNSFGYLDPRGTSTFVEAVSRALRPGARFALDYGMAAECVLPSFREREWVRVDDILFLEENRYLVDQGCIETRYTFVRDGETHRRTGLHWVYTVREVRRMLEAAGLKTLDVSSSLDGDAFEVGSPYLVLLAEKS